MDGVHEVLGAEARGEFELGLLDVDGDHGSAHEPGVLDREMAQAADAEHSDQLGRLDLGDLEGFVGGHARAAQGRGIDRGNAVRYGDDVGGAGDCVLRERSVDRVAAVVLLLAQRLATVDAESTLAASGSEPGDRDALADGSVRHARAEPLDDADPLVARDERQRGFTGHSPRAAWMSVWHKPHASRRISTCPTPGSGVSRSTISSASENEVTTAAFMAGPFAVS